MNLMAKIVPLMGKGFECNSYLILDETCLLIDTGTGSRKDLPEKVKALTPILDMIINTHAHLDHVGGNQFFDAPVSIHEADAEELERGGLYGTAHLFNKEFHGKIDHLLKDGEVIDLGDLSLEVIHTPGHTPGSICLLSNEGHLFSGDTLFSGGSFGRTDLKGGSSSELVASLERLNTIRFKSLMPGHDQWVDDGKANLKAALELCRMYL